MRGDVNEKGTRMFLTSAESTEIMSECIEALELQNRLIFSDHEQGDANEVVRGIIPKQSTTIKLIEWMKAHPDENPRMGFHPFNKLNRALTKPLYKLQ